MDQANFRTCLNILHNAETDTEKFAALLVVTKKLNSSELSLLQTRALFEAVGFNFLHRLLVTKQVPRGCPDDIFKSVGLAIFASFCNDPDLVKHEKLPDIIDVLKEIFSARNVSEPIFSDAVQCIDGLSMIPEAAEILASKNFAACLTDLYLTQNYKPALRMLVLLCSRTNCMWSSDLNSFHRIMTKLSSDFVDDNTLTKFETGEALVRLFNSNPNVKINEYPLPNWCFQVREGLRVILQNKLIKSQRDMALKLAAAAVEKFGAYWILEESNESNKFFSVLVHIVCIEIRMCLEDKDIDSVILSSAILLTCFTILESVITILSDEYVWHMSDENAPQLVGAIQQAFSAVIGFLKSVSNNWEFSRNDTSQRIVCTRQLALACVRILAAWMAEESLALLRTDISQILPFLMVIAKDSLQELNNPSECNLLSGIDVTRFLLPAMCHITADDSARKLFLKNGGLVLVYRYLDYAWNLYPGIDNEGPEKYETWIATICGVLLNIVVMEREAITKLNCGLFFTLLKFFVTTLPQLPGGGEYITLKANFSVLGLLIVKYYANNIKCLETSFYKFLSASIKFLWDSHNIEVANDTPSLVVVREYRKAWSNIVELWFLGMQVLSSLLPVIQWIPTFLLESGFPQHIISCLSRIGEHDIDASTRSSYQNLLCSIIQNCPEAAEMFRTHGAAVVCSIHNLQELKSLLSSSV